MAACRRRRGRSTPTRYRRAGAPQGLRLADQRAELGSGRGALRVVERVAATERAEPLQLQAEPWVELPEHFAPGEPHALPGAGRAAELPPLGVALEGGGEHGEAITRDPVAARHERRGLQQAVELASRLALAAALAAYLVGAREGGPGVVPCARRSSRAVDGLADQPEVDRRRLLLALLRGARRARHRAHGRRRLRRGIAADPRADRRLARDAGAADQELGGGARRCGEHAAGGGEEADEQEGTRATAELGRRRRHRRVEPAFAAGGADPAAAWRLAAPVRPARTALIRRPPRRPRASIWARRDRRLARRAGDSFGEPCGWSSTPARRYPRRSPESFLMTTLRSLALVAVASGAVGLAGCGGGDGGTATGSAGGDAPTRRRCSSTPSSRRPMAARSRAA